MTNAQIAIVHGATASFRKFTDITFENHAEYARKHGYMLKTASFKSPEPWWQKIHALQETLADSAIRRVFWIDADALFTNYTLSLTEHLPNSKIVISCDIFGMNIGTFWIENCLEVRLLLEAIASKGCELFAGRVWPEQSALRYFVLHPPYNKIITYVEQTQMNSYLNEFYAQEDLPRPQDGFGEWHPGDFILHLPAISPKARMQIFKKILPFIKK